jgi:TolB protein
MVDIRRSWRSSIRLHGPVLLGLGLLAGADAPPNGQLGSLIRLTRDGLEKERPSWAPDGRRLLFARHASGGMQVWQYVLDMKTSGASPRRLTDRREPEYNGAFSPDGTRILFAAITLSGTQGNLDIAAINADGSGLKTVFAGTEGLSHQDWPSWSPDGRRFAFSSTHEGNQEIYTAQADGTGLIRLTNSPGIDAHPAWSPDGRGIAFATDRWGGLELAAVRPDGSGLVRLTRSRGLDDYPSFSPDGRRLAFVSNRDGQFEVYISASDGTGPVNLSSHPLRDTFPSWSPDGRGVTFVSDRDGGCDIYTRIVDADRESPIGGRELGGSDRIRRRHRRTKSEGTGQVPLPTPIRIRTLRSVSLNRSLPRLPALEDPDHDR